MRRSVLRRKTGLKASKKGVKRTPLARSPMKRGGPVRPVNRKRKASEFARCYGSRARVAFVKSLPCCWCSTCPSDNAHTETGGAGYKADYQTVAPLCRSCHQDYDERRWPFDMADVRRFIQHAAIHTERMWASHLSQRSTAAA